MKCRMYTDIDSYKRELLYEGELTIEVLKKVEEWCKNHTATYENYIPAFHICDNGDIEIGPSGAWAC